MGAAKQRCGQCVHYRRGWPAWITKDGKGGLKTYGWCADRKFPTHANQTAPSCLVEIGL